MVMRLICAASAAVAVMGTAQTPFQDHGNLSVDKRDAIMTEMNARRAAHGACEPLVWDQSLADALIPTLQTKDDQGADSCKAMDTSKEFNAYHVYIMTFKADPANPPMWVPQDAVEEWYAGGTGDAFKNLAWASSNKVGCAQCRVGSTNQGHMSYIYCKFSPQTGSEAENVKPAGSTCDKCLQKSCPNKDPCKNDGTCDPKTGNCVFPNKADGETCDDGDAMTENDQCKSGVCSGTAIDRCAGVVCTAAGPCVQAATCDPQTGTCPPGVNLADGTPCDDNNPATAPQTQKCQQGVCVGTDLCMGVTCTAQSTCHMPGVCNPADGKCSNPPKGVGEQCDDSNPDTVNDVCDASQVCAGKDLCAGVNCVATGCTETSVCNKQTGTCDPTFKPTGTPCDDGIATTRDDACTATGACVGQDDGCSTVTCTASEPCQASSFCIPSTATDPATCGFTYVAEGTACQDGDAATTNDKCVKDGNKMVCKGTNLCENVACPETECRKAGTCNPADGRCAYEDKADGEACDDGDDTTNDTCQKGKCVGVAKCAGVDCSMQGGACTVGQCEATTGACVVADKTDGTACDDGDAKTVEDSCKKGVCEGIDKCAAPCVKQDMTNTCTASQGICDKMTGECTFPLMSDGTPCDDGNPATQNDQCKSGLCVGGADCTIKLVDSWSRSPCLAGESYGWTAGGSLWVDKGCRGKFTLSNGHTLKCESWRWTRCECSTFPKVPQCSGDNVEPCPTNAPCNGFINKGSGYCVDGDGKRFRALVKKYKTHAACVNRARRLIKEGLEVAAAEYQPNEQQCNILFPTKEAHEDGKKKGNVGWVAQIDGMANAPVVGTDKNADVTCWVSEDNCKGVKCEAIDDCHLPGVCNKATGKCSNPEKSEGSFCDDGNANTWRDTCQIKGNNPIKCMGETGPRECWIANQWGGERKCVKDDKACGWASGVYPSEAACCKNSFSNGCKSSSTVPSCWVADKSWPTMTCKQLSGKSDACRMPTGNWQSEQDCCAPGAAHKYGCKAPTDKDKNGNNGVADRPEQCICSSKHSPFMAMYPSAEEYCASVEKPNGANGRKCIPLPPNMSCASQFKQCRKARSVPKSGGAVCACGSYFHGAMKKHSRLCLSKSGSVSSNACFPSNSNGACGNPDWMICLTKTTFTVTIKVVVSVQVFSTQMGRMAGLPATGHGKVVVKNSCGKKSRGHRGSSYAMKQYGCTGGWSWGSGYTTARSAGVLEAAEDTDVVFSIEGLDADEENEARQTLFRNMDIMKKATPEEKKALFKKDPEMIDTMNQMDGYVQGPVVAEAAPAGEGETDTEIEEAKDKPFAWLWAVIAAVCGLMAVVGVAVAVRRHNAGVISDDRSEKLVNHESFTANAAELRSVPSSASDDTEI